jgi:hypothetical protein
MKTSMIRVAAGLAVFGATLAAPTAALADNTFWQYEVNDGNGNCYEVTCGPYGCAVTDIYYCPREVGDQ